MTEESFGSLWERNIYMALQKFKIPFDYQVPMFGGRRRRGGTVIDFVVYDPPGKIALFVDGPYWHNQAKRRLEDELIRRELEKDGYRVMAVEEESETQEGAEAWVRKEIAKF